VNAVTYQDAARLMYRLSRYIDQLALYEGGEMGVWKIGPADISGRALKVAIPRGSVTSAQQGAIEAAEARAQAFDVDLKFLPF
jgi:hypothetical protein